MKLPKPKWLIVVGAILIVSLFAAFNLGHNNAPQYFSAKAERGDIRQVVEATGDINAVITVQVGSQVSGTIDKLAADFNSRVRKGQIIARIEPSLFEGALLQAKADLVNARANLLAARATLEKDKATAEQTRADYARTAGLAKDGVMSLQQLDLAKASAEAAAAEVSAANAQVQQAAAQVQQKAAAVAVAQTNLDHAIIRAPIDGTVIARSVDVGQTVAASLQAPTLFTIAQDLTKMQVYAKTDESDVGMIHPGQIVSFKVDAFPRDTFSGRVEQVRMNATTVQNVVTYDTVIDFDNPDLKLFPGMTAYITIPVATANDVLRVPNGALRYKPDMKPEEIRALLGKYGMQGGEGRPGASPTGAGASQDTSTAVSPGNTHMTGASGKQFRASNSQAQTRAPQLDVAVVWKLKSDKTLEPVKVRTGITDHTVTEVVQVIKGDLSPGDELVIGSGAGRTTSSARMPGVGGGAPRR